MSKTIQSVRGMNDLLPDTLALWQRVEQVLREVLHAYGYQEIRFPVVESTELFVRSIGEVTDIVEKEMYTFEDRNGDSLTLRPEGTASCVRAAVQNGLLHNQTQRFWYTGPMFRHERPQKGRYRQFHQLGVETFGMEGPDVDAELIIMSQRFWKALNLQGLTLELNSLGTPASRQAHRQALLAYLESHRDALDDDSLRRLEHNPLRILDSKHPETRKLVQHAPQLLNYLDDDSKAHFEGLRRYLDDAGIDYVVNPHLVRGLDYYTKTVFEWTTDRLGAQSTVCAGGRFDGLVEQLGGRATCAAGFAMGLERLIELWSLDEPQTADNGPQVYMVLLGEAAATKGAPLAEQLRDAGLRVMMHCGGGSMKSQFKKADRSGARYAVVLGEDEVRNSVASIKPLREPGDQQAVSLDQLASRLVQQCADR